MQNYRNGKWANQIISMQHPDGSWGCFHTLRRDSDTPMTTEMALLRLELLGYTAEDKCIKRAIAHMETLLHTGELPEGKEKTSDFETFVDLIVAARIRRFTDQCESANEIAGKWAQVITNAFSSGTYSQTDYDECYTQVFGRKPKGGRLIDFVNFYQLSILSGMLDKKTENLMLDYVLRHEGGIYYVYENRLDKVPDEFQSKKASRYLAAIELLARYESGKDKLSFAYDWLKSNQQADGTWDMGVAAKDGVYFPLSDRWDKTIRITDSTHRIGKLFSLKLTHDNFIKARDYIFANAGDIDRAWFRYIFEDKDEDAFLDVLAKYQYDSGGFGGLYYEFDYQGPCLKSTEIAVKYILNLEKKPSADHPVIRKAMQYLLDNYLPEIGNWCEVVVPAVNDGVHCYWVRYRGEDVTPIEDEDERIRRYDANEKVCFAAFVSYYSELVSQDVCRDILKYPTEHILRYWDKNSQDYNRSIFDGGVPYNFEYFQEFILYLKDRSLADKLISILRQNPTAFMELDFEKSKKEYVHLPCDSVDSPDSVVYPVVKNLVDMSLEYRMRQQGDDGRWPLGWSFGSDAGLQELQVKYEAYRTLLMLVKLERFGRIEK